jgi:tetratricopeptide (TPR) repeat protein
MNTEKLNLAIQYRGEDKFDLAESLFNELIADYPDNPELYYHMAWLNDRMGREIAAVPYYVKAIELGLSGDDLRGALLGLGSTYRTIGQYENAVVTLKKGIESFPDAHEFPVFLAMAFYNTGQNKDAVSMLLNLLLETTNSEAILRFKRAIALYAEDLDQLWLD